MKKDPCRVREEESRVCERGTKGCMSRHIRPLSNFHAAPLRVTHAKLQIASFESAFRRYCPTCVKGVLMVSREQETFSLIDVDRCIYCGQMVIYDDEIIGNEPVKRVSVISEEGR